MLGIIKHPVSNSIPKNCTFCEGLTCSWLPKSSHNQMALGFDLDWVPGFVFRSFFISFGSLPQSNDNNKGLLIIAEMPFSCGQMWPPCSCVSVVTYPYAKLETMVAQTAKKDLFYLRGTRKEEKKNRHPPHCCSRLFFLFISAEGN